MAENTERAVKKFVRVVVGVVPHTGHPRGRGRSAAGSDWLRGRWQECP
ncbi:hypothetical protein SAMN05216533_3155 [Streptomyces sp. Ag109_O5-10]|nr:hypothetical protein SAMN05216533_3155 [Streptomyces sp. Ag109_O5-10]